MNMHGPEKKGGTPLSSTGSPGVALLTAAKMVRALTLGADPGDASAGLQDSVGAVYSRLLDFWHVPSDPEAVGVDHHADHLPWRVALDQQPVFTFQHYGGERCRWSGSPSCGRYCGWRRDGWPGSPRAAPCNRGRRRFDEDMIRRRTGRMFPDTGERRNECLRVDLRRRGD